ncbi:MAG TPA: TolC family protein, partial [Opitutaceae bacterium]|nr:TolC family protein [Opitutaceae bacterium]
PDVRAAERQLAAATARIGVAKAELYPHLGLAGSLGFVGTTTAGLFDYSNRYFSFGPGLHWNLFAGGRTRAQIAAAEARTAGAYANYRKTVLGALADADNALGAFAADQRRETDLVAAVATSRKAVATATELYREGVTDYLSVLDAQRSLAAAEDNLAQGDRAKATDLVALYKSLGGGWPVAPADTFVPGSISTQTTTHS